MEELDVEELDGTVGDLQLSAAVLSKRPSFPDGLEVLEIQSLPAGELATAGSIAPVHKTPTNIPP